MKSAVLQITDYKKLRLLVGGNSCAAVFILILTGIPGVPGKPGSPGGPCKHDVKFIRKITPNDEDMQ